MRLFNRIIIGYTSKCRTSHASRISNIESLIKYAYALETGYESLLNEVDSHSKRLCK